MAIHKADRTRTSLRRQCYTFRAVLFFSSVRWQRCRTSISMQHKQRERAKSTQLLSLCIAQIQKQCHLFVNIFFLLLLTQLCILCVGFFFCFFVLSLLCFVDSHLHNNFVCIGSVELTRSQNWMNHPSQVIAMRKQLPHLRCHNFDWRSESSQCE